MKLDKAGLFKKCVLKYLLKFTEKPMQVCNVIGNNEIVLAFLPFESKTNILHVNINFTGNLFFGFGRYRGKAVPEPAVSHPF